MISASSFAYPSDRLYVMIISDNAHFVNRFWWILIYFIGFVLCEQFFEKEFVVIAQKIKVAPPVENVDEFYDLLDTYFSFSLHTSIIKEK